MDFLQNLNLEEIPPQGQTINDFMDEDGIFDDIFRIKEVL
jgi:hypothetical protein